MILRYFIITVSFICLSSCSLLSGGIKTSYESDENADKIIKEKSLGIESITVNKSFDSESVKENAAYAFDVILGQEKLNRLKAEAVFKEDSFVKGFDQLNTVSLELTVKDSTDRILKIILITEESENTLSSYKYLYKIIEKGIKEAGL